VANVEPITSSFDDLRQRIAALREQVRRVAGGEQGAWGVDGHTFAFEVALSRPLPVGGYVTLTTRDGRVYLGQVTDQRIITRPGPQVTLDLDAALGGDTPLGEAAVNVNVRLASGGGSLLATLRDGAFGGVDRHATFDIATIAAAPGKVVDDFLTWSLGGATGLDTAAASFGTGEVLPLLAAKGFNRHTFLCGQSGSGKTYGLGVLLERLLLLTTIKMMIVDPNSDYVGLGHLLPREASGAEGEAYDRVARHWQQLSPRIVVVGPGDGAIPFKVVFGRLTTGQQALVLGLDPVRDHDDFAAFRTLRDAAGGGELRLPQMLAYAEASDDPHLRRLAVRIRNVGAPEWDVWADEGDTAVLDALPDDVRVLIVDLGRSESASERAVQSAAALEWMWRSRHEREPRLIVIDEAHNVCPQVPEDPIQAVATDHAVRIAAEGRKYGLYLLLSTQQPQKIHANVLAQCDNLILLRMNSTVDIDHLTRVFGFVPATLLQQAAAFRLGEGLVAGRISSHPVRYQGARRWTREGGADVPTTWASRDD
jgi:hypothetical protein